MEIFEFLKDQPLWLIVFGFFIYLLVKIAPNFFPQYFDKKNCEQRCKDLQAEIEQLKSDLEKEKKKTAKIIIENQERNDNFNQMKGAILMIKKTLEENGFEGIDELLNIKQDEP